MNELYKIQTKYVDILKEIPFLYVKQDRYKIKIPNIRKIVMNWLLGNSIVLFIKRLDFLKLEYVCDCDTGA